MRIEWTPPLRPAAQRRDDRGSAGGGSFPSALGGDPAATVATPASTAMQTVEGLLSLQEVADGLAGRRRGVARGEQLLDALEELRLALLAGAVPRGQLAALARLAAEQVPLVDDPRLAAILGEIELRAAVELAKLGDAQ